MADLLDTNVLLRFLVGDNEKQQKQARIWFEEAEAGKREILIPVIVIAEACFVLESFYKKSRQVIAEVFEILLGHKWLVVENKEIILELWYDYQCGLHFVDSYLAAAARINKSSVLTFDQQLGKKV